METFSVYTGNRNQFIKQDVILCEGNLFSSYSFLAISQIVHALEVKQITFEQGKMLQPVLAPGNKMIAFLQEQNGKTSLYLKPFSVTGGTAPGQKNLTKITENLTTSGGFPQEVELLLSKAPGWQSRHFDCGWL